MYRPEVSGDIAAALEFLQLWAPGEPAQLTAIEPDTRKITTKFFPTETGRADWIAAWIGRRNIYFTVNPLRHPLDRKPTKLDIAAMAWAHVDIDPAPGEEPSQAKDKALARLNKSKPRPSVVLDSGGGVQAFWRLREPVPVHGNIGDLEAINRALETALGGDHCHNLDRIMRLPGTINLPDAKKRAKGRIATAAKLLRVEKLDYDPADFPAVETPRIGPRTDGPHSSIDLDEGLPRITVLENIPELAGALHARLRALIKIGTDPNRAPYPSRSEALFAAVCGMLRAGCGDKTILAIILNPNFRISESVLEHGAEAMKYAKRQLQSARAKQEAKDNGSRPNFECVGGALPGLVRGAQAALIGATAQPTIFQRAGRLVRIGHLEDASLHCGLTRPHGAVAVIDVDREYLILRLTEIATWQRFDQRSKNWRVIDAPREVASALLANVGSWPFPTLRAVIEAPTLRPDGTCLDKPGFDEATGLLFDPRDGEFEPIPKRPLRSDAVAAVDIFADLLKGFPFLDPSNESAIPRATISFAVFLSGILTALVRPSLRSAPMFGLTAPRPGSGKSLLVDVASLICTGRPAAVMSYTGKPDEERKRLFAALLGGTNLIAYDNVAAPLDSDTLCSVLTQETFQDRFLGASKNLEVPTCATFFATGNNLVFRGDLSTRALLCRLDPRCERPEERQFDINLYQAVPRLRPLLIRAALTILCAYVVAGRPKQAFSPFGRFEEWSSLIRSALVWAGLEDPCASRTFVAADDPVSADLARLLVAWEAAFRGAPTTVAEAIEATKSTGPEAANLLVALAPFMDRGEVNARKVGWFIAKHRDRIEGGQRFRKYEDSSGGIRWFVETESAQ